MFVNLRQPDNCRPHFCITIAGLRPAAVCTCRRCNVLINLLSPKIHIQILQTDLHTFLLRIVERIWFKIKVFSLC